MHWTEPATADDSHADLEKKLWDAANMLWAGAALKPSEYSPTVLGLIFLRYADVRFSALFEHAVAQQWNLVTRNKTLRRTRDRLLPKLLSQETFTHA